MKRRSVITRKVYATLALCVCATPAAVGQTPAPQHQTDNANQYTINVGVPDLFSDGMLTPPADRRTQAISANYRPPTPEQWATMKQAAILGGTAALSLYAGRYAEAEAEARQAISVDLPTSGMSQEVLASALEAQGKDREALHQYQTVVEHYDRHPSNLLPYALLLLKSGQWEQALAMYDQALPILPDVGPHLEAVIVHDKDAMQSNSHFSPDAPDPVALATALHIARGLVYNTTCDWAGGSQDKKALAEYEQALQLAPNNALANYYCGVGWQKLSPAERAQFGTAQQARAALQKAMRLGKGDVKAAAEKALRGV